ncbi:MFS transporter, partial [Klebsiella pneumoniae]
LTLIDAGMALAIVSEAGKEQDKSNVEYPAAAGDQPIDKSNLAEE